MGHRELQHHGASCSVDVDGGGTGKGKYEDGGNIEGDVKGFQYVEQLTLRRQNLSCWSLVASSMICFACSHLLASRIGFSISESRGIISSIVARCFFRACYRGLGSQWEVHRAPRHKRPDESHERAA